VGRVALVSLSVANGARAAVVLVVEDDALIRSCRTPAGCGLYRNRDRKGSYFQIDVLRPSRVHRSEGGLLMTAVGQKRIWPPCPVNVRFTSQSGHRLSAAECRR
jgi:hypothetical protein